jgi:hypothetical protein
VTLPATDRQTRALAARLVRDLLALPGTIEDLQRAVVFIQDALAELAKAAAEQRLRS